MTQNQITQIPVDKVTKPIQLLAAWLVGLIAIDSAFLLGARNILKPEWASGLLVVAAVVNVPLFIFALFLLQTKFRPQMQEDSYYSRFLQDERQYGFGKSTTSEVTSEKKIAETAEKIAHTIGSTEPNNTAIKAILREQEIDTLIEKFANSRALNELYFRKDRWGDVLKQYGKSNAFMNDVERLILEGLVERKDDYQTAMLTELGEKVAIAAEARGMLLPQTKTEFWNRSTRVLDKAAAAQES